MTLLEQLQQLTPLAEAATLGPWKPVASSSPVAGEETTHSVDGPWSDFMYLHEAADAAFIAQARNVLTPENLQALCAALAAPVAAASTAETMRWIEYEIVRTEAENEAMYKTAREEDVAACRYNSVRLHTLKTIRQRLGSDNATC